MTTVPRDSHISMRYVLIGLLAAPFAWLLQMMLAETLAAQACYPHDHPLGAPLVSWMRPAIVALGTVCLVAGAFGTWVAWRNLRRVAPLKLGGLNGERRTRAELDWFLTHVAVMTSMLFLFALIATDVAVAIVSPCRWW
ncbi:hypothetical protein [Paraburkholderia youngii]|uniref:Cytochrome C oxidase subunit I n=1 Tax=Paraburkholderia youngii TaxID=2782701 RepID=A0ABX2NN49_9BURK|nr:hypothetical protein [Paraburkholderia youngii]NUX52916.1 hypothetical protein [Paraburkholderia youngii]NVI05873.1 hypothetical protein [Paraburkholderia youngii]